MNRMDFLSHTVVDEEANITEVSVVDLTTIAVEVLVEEITMAIADIQEVEDPVDTVVGEVEVVGDFLEDSHPDRRKMNWDFMAI